ncbi:MAG: hypothetical protein IKB80_02130 [Oscillospiraceae bacterium]|nr:hypothetical protein [Oscillospiraceae bacterium]
MTKKIVSLLLVCLLLTGCNQTAVDRAGTTVSSSEEAQISVTENTTEATENGTSATDSADTEESTTPVQPLPQPVSFWNPICNEYISLFPSTESTEAFATIPRGATIGLVNWEGRFARVVWDGKVGYVYSNCLQPAESDYFAKHLKVLTPTTKYTYDQMYADMGKLQALYPDLISLSTIGKSELMRDIPVMIVGNTDAKYHILVQAAIHGREHFTAWIAMAMMDSILKQGALPSDVCYHIIPMSNPDGVFISQSGKLEERQIQVYELDLDFGHTNSSTTEYATQWKANACGEDINRNFMAGWDVSNERDEQSAQKYRGETPFSASEARALRDYTLSRTFHATISLHSHGSVLYYQYGTKQPVNRLSYSLAQAVQGVTGYVPTAYDNTSGAGYKDWAMEELGIPSLTVEIGSAATPIPQQDIYNTFDRCRDMLPTVYKWVTQN